VNITIKIDPDQNNLALSIAYNKILYKQLSTDQGAIGTKRERG